MTRREAKAKGLPCWVQTATGKPVKGEFFPDFKTARERADALEASTGERHFVCA